jgi:hypothetical protein
MKRMLLVLPFVFVACESAVMTEPHRSPVAASANFAAGGSPTCTIGTKTYARGFDEFGYNSCARNFVGLFGGWCADYGAGWDCSGAGFEGYAPYAYDHLVMKWNAEWDRGNAENWLNPPYDAWTDNELNGMLPNGSKFTEHAKIRWVGPCGADGTALPDGGYCIWGIFEAVMDQGMDQGTRWVLAHATPGGYGAPR